MRMILNNLNGVANRAQIGEYKSGSLMMKYNEIMICEEKSYQEDNPKK